MMENNVRLEPAQALVPQYRDLRFKSPVELERWLRKTATKKIHFEYHTQVLLVMWIDGHGEVLNCNLGAGMYVGYLVQMEGLAVGKALKMGSETDVDYSIYSNLIIEKIEELNAPQSV